VTDSPGQRAAAVELAEADEATLYGLFAGVRAAELAMDGWEPALRDLVLRQQYDARRRGYRARYPHAREYAIVAGGTAAGYGVIDRSAPFWRLVDIAVAHDWRRRGIAAGVVRRWQDEAAAARCGMRLSVMHGNTAARALYDRLGFRVTGEDGTHVEMEWQR
jgi:ribosomal protein S18 acetylase RimI-like enzyme